MIIGIFHGKRRCAATAVETALVLIPLMMFLFGIFEYGRLLMDWNLLNNAAREGCRYALANNQDPAISTDVQTIAVNYMAGRTASFSTFTATVSGVSMSGPNQGTVYTGNGVNNLMPGDIITVTVSGNYQFMNIIPLASMTSSSPMTSSVTMICEGGT
jgi:Flp pilus assembly protein TadG